MSRIIKFRAWDKVSKIFLEWDILCQFSFEDIQKDKSKILTQFTGLYDKTGKEIYEGDIIKNQNGDLRMVVYFQNGFEMRLMNKRMQSDNIIWHFNSEVIGNIYENPELLEGGQV